MALIIFLYAGRIIIQYIKSPRYDNSYVGVHLIGSEAGKALVATRSGQLSRATIYWAAESATLLMFVLPLFLTHFKYF
jgi:hypothetical protein